MTAPIHVLYVGETVAPVTELRERQDTKFTVCLAASREDALARLGETAFDCIVYSRTATDDGRFLGAVREHAPSLPVVLRAAKGDVDVSSDAYDRVVDDETALAAAVADAATATRGHLAPAADDSEETGGETDSAKYRSRHDLFLETPGFLEAVLDSLLDVFFVFTVDRELVEWNTPLEEVTGRSGEDLAGADPLSFLAPEHRDRAFESLAEVLTSGRATAEFDIVSEEGDRTAYEFTASLVTDDGAPRYICGIGRDVTDLRQKQAELRRKQAELDQAVEELERSNAELEQFAYVASHDMKEPLRMVTSYLQLLERRYGDQLDEDAEEFVEYAVDGAERMRTMIDQLLAYSRIDRKGDPFRPVDCEGVLATVESNLQVAIEESGTELDVGTLPTVSGDRDQLVQLFQNLVSNAIKYNRGTPRVEVAAERRGDRWEFTVADNGIGIPADHVDRVFDPFYGHAYGMADVESTGIGLAICQRIVDRHGGDIRVESVEGEGTTFHFTLPDADADPEESARESTALRSTDFSDE